MGAILAGVVLGLLAATKETFVLSVISVVLALIFIRGIPLKEVLLLHAFCMFSAAALSCAFVFGQLSAGALIGSGIWEWSKKGLSDETQYQPIWFFLSLILKTSPLVLGALLLLPTKNRDIRYWLFAGFGLVFFYSLIPYKTPWLLITALPPIYIALALSLSKKRHVLIAVAVATIFSSLPFANEYLANDDTSPEVRKFSNDVIERCQKVGESCKVFVGARWYWPLPYYLKSLEGKVSYAEGPKAIPLSEYSAVILDAKASIEPSGWSREEFKLSRVQRLALYLKN